MVADLLDVLPAGAALAVTSDHGQVEVGKRVSELSSRLLSEVAMQSGEARFRWLHAKDTSDAGVERLAKIAEDLYGKLRGAGIEVLYDDRDESPGAKFATVDLIGLPDQLVIGPRGVAAGTVELKHRRSGERKDIPAETALDRVTAT